MDKIVKLIYKNSSNKKLIRIFNQYKFNYEYYKNIVFSQVKYVYNSELKVYIKNMALNSYCNCNSDKIYINDTDAYGEYIICSNCNICCGWKDGDDYFDVRGINILDNLKLANLIHFKISY